MPTQLLLTGATGYVGGALLAILVSQLTPDCNITCLARTEEQASLLKSTYPGVSTILGTLESRDLLIAEAAKADIVLHAANVDHEAGTLALLDGLKEHRLRTEKELLYLLVSGSASLLDQSNMKPGQPMAKAYDDVLDAEDIWNLPLERPHVAIERRFVQEADSARIKTIIVSPSHIFHTGIGVGKKESYLNEHPRAIIRYGRPFVVNEGKNLWCWISIEDLADAICFLLRKYLDHLDGKQASGQGFGKDGYYYVQTGELSGYEQASVLGEELFKLGAIQSKNVDQLTEEQVVRLNDYGVLLWGSSMRSKGQKLRDLGWEPKELDWKDLVRRAARAEWQAFQRGQVPKAEYQRV